MKTVQVTLEEARQLITLRSRWIQGEYVGPNGRFCAVGAIEEVGYRAGGDRKGANRALRRVLRPTFGDNSPNLYGLLGIVFSEPRITSFNDNSPHDCVLAAFDRAIEKEAAS